MPTIGDLMLGVVLPAVVCGLVLAWAWRARSVESPPPQRGMFAGAIAFAAAFVTVHVAILGALVLPSANRQLAVQDWIPWLALAAIPFAWLQAANADRRAVQTLVRALLAAVRALTYSVSQEGQFGASSPWSSCS